MDAELLRSRKLVYHKWLQNHGETKKAKPPIILGRRWTYRLVVEFRAHSVTFENIFRVKRPPKVEILPRETGHPRWAQVEILSAQNGWAHGVYVFGHKRVGPSTGI
ncbi:hypothetical protein P692DRAFT_201811105 [Suillus brevipes Sb2]|nr:hypothetical protein P692DRAFT_201811105 [Suillus brevipes Sb2]